MEGRQLTSGNTRIPNIPVYNLDDLVQIDLDSPRDLRHSRGKDGARCCQLCGLCSDSMFAPSNPILGGETLSQVTNGLCCGKPVMFCLRFCSLMYLLGTYLYLGIRGSLSKYTVSAEIYALQLCSSFLIMVPVFLPQSVRRGISPLIATLPSQSAPMHSPMENGIEDQGCSCEQTVRQFSCTLGAVVLQAAAGLAIFWCFVFWAKLRRYMQHNSIDVVMLHGLNLIPVVVELVFGSVCFNYAYFFPGMVFIITYLVVLSRHDETNTDWISLLFSAGTYSPSKLYVTITQLTVMYILSCTLLYVLQRFMHYIAIRKFPRRTWSLDRAEIDPIEPEQDVSSNFLLTRQL